MPYLVAVQQVGIESIGGEERLTTRMEIPAVMIAAVFQFTNALSSWCCRDNICQSPFRRNRFVDNVLGLQFCGHCISVMGAGP